MLNELSVEVFEEQSLFFSVDLGGFCIFQRNNTMARMFRRCADFFVNALE